MRVGVLVNPAAGGGRGEARARELVDLLPEAEVRWRRTDAASGAGPPAADLAPEVDVLAVVGGDGTLREAVEGLWGAGLRVPLLPAPAGRGNSLVAHLYGEGGWRKAASNLGPDPPTRPLDAGRIEGEGWGPRVLVLGAGVGVLAAAAEGLDLPLVPARLGYVTRSAGSWFRGGDRPVRVVVDGEVLHEGPARLAAVGGGELRAGSVPLFPGASLADGLLDALAVGPVPPWRVPGLARAVARGTHPELPGVSHGRGREVVLERDEAGPVEVDGTVFRDAPARLSAEALPGACDVVALPRLDLDRGDPGERES